MDNILLALKVNTVKVLELNYLDDIAKKILASKDPIFIETNLRYVLQFYSVLNYEMAYERSYLRARKCLTPSGYNNVSELGCPPNELVQAGRLNEPNEPILYVSTSQFSILEEINCEEGDYVHVIAYEHKPSTKIRCAILGEATQVSRWGRALSSEHLGIELNRIMNGMTFDVGRSFVYTDAFLSSIMKDVSASQNNYIHSRLLAKLLLEKHDGLDGIIYPSVALESAMNIAIKPQSAEKLFKIGANFVLKVNKKYQFGIYDFEVLRNAKGQYNDGSIIW